MKIFDVVSNRVVREEQRMMGMPDHHFHALVAQERIESLRSTMLASRRRRRRRDEDAQETAGQVLPRLSLHGDAAGQLTRRTA